MVNLYIYIYRKTIEDSTNTPKGHPKMLGKTTKLPKTTTKAKPKKGKTTARQHLWPLKTKGARNTNKEDHQRETTQHLRSICKNKKHKEDPGNMSKRKQT